jgi:hypothetical protein
LLNLGWCHEAAQATTQIYDIFSDPPPKLRDLSKIGSKRGGATTDTEHSLMVAIKIMAWAFPPWKFRKTIVFSATFWHFRRFSPIEIFTEFLAV